MAMALLKRENKLGLKTQELKRIKMSLIYVKEYKDTNYKDNGEHKDMILFSKWKI